MGCQIMYECLECGRDILNLVSVDLIGDTVICTHCGNRMFIECEESYDEDEESFEIYLVPSGR